MRRKYRRRKKISSFTIILIFISLLFLLSIGYAKFSTQLTLNGSVTGSSSSDPGTGSGPGVALIISNHSEETGDGTLKTDGTIHYFQGTSDGVNNYFSFNSELWRIIGIDSNGIKIQRVESLGAMAWNDTKSKDWSTATLNTYLNTTYFSSLSDTSNVVLNPVWNVGESTDGKTLASNIDYSGTDSDPRPVALVNVNELTNAGGSTGWLTKNAYYWTMTGAQKNQTVYRYNVDKALNSNPTTECQIEPVLYIKDTVNLSGNGTADLPYTII